MAQTRRPEGFLGLEATAGLRVHLFPGARRWTHRRHSVGTLAGSPRRRPCGGGPGARRSVPTAPRFSRKAEGKAPPAAELPPEYLTSPLSQQSQLPPKRDETALQEEEELQLALALSQSEAEEKERMVSGERAGPEASPHPGCGRGASQSVWGLGPPVPRAPCTTLSSWSSCRDRSLRMPRTPRPSLHPWPHRLPPPAACTPRPW